MAALPRALQGGSTAADYSLLLPPPPALCLGPRFPTYEAHHSAVSFPPLQIERLHTLFCWCDLKLLPYLVTIWFQSIAATP